MHRVPSASEVTAGEIARCTRLDVQLAAQRRELRRECERQRAATRRVAARVESLARARPRR